MGMSKEQILNRLKAMRTELDYFIQALETEVVDPKAIEGLPANGPIIVHTDGGSRGNPGPSGVGVTVEADSFTFHANKFIGAATNNEAEYEAALLAIEVLEAAGARNRSVIFQADSQLLVSQISGEWKIKEPRMKSKAHQIHEKLRELGLNGVWSHIPREENRVADSLANKAMDGVLVWTHV